MFVMAFRGNKSARLELEWVVISKQRIYTAVMVVVVMLISASIGLYFWFGVRLLTSPRSDQRRAEGARFRTFEGVVKVVRADTRETINIDASTRLYPGDTVQTHANGYASVTLADDSTLTISPNSVITIAENSGIREGRYAHVRVAVEGGRVNVRTETQGGETSNIVETPLARNSLSAQTTASFDVLEDNSEEIRVIIGSMETNMPVGRTKIHAGEYIALSKLGDIKRRERLLDTVVPYAPLDLEHIRVREDEATTRITLQWTRAAASTDVSYDVVIAASPFFVKSGIIFERERLISTKLVVTELKTGNYFWRVRAVSATGQKSPWSEPQKFTVVRMGSGASTEAAKD
jgi:hypothetical protein